MSAERDRLRRLTRQLGCVVVALCALGCGRGSASGTQASASSDPIPTPHVSARRPSVRFLMKRTTDRCEVYWIDGDEKSPSIDAPCPEDLLLGEDLRLAGMTCMRESAAAERQVPVVCPDPLTNLEKTYRKTHVVAK